jgi:hypothetical protein
VVEANTPGAAAGVQQAVDALGPAAGRQPLSPPHPETGVSKDQCPLSCPAGQVSKHSSINARGTDQINTPSPPNGKDINMPQVGTSRLVKGRHMSSEPGPGPAEPRDCHRPSTNADGTMAAAIHPAPPPPADSQQALDQPQPSHREPPVDTTPAGVYTPAEPPHDMLESPPLTGAATEEAGARQLPEVLPYAASSGSAPDHGQGSTAPQPALQQLLSAAAVVPYWYKKDHSLQLKLPQHAADACDGIQLEIGGVLLPRACTRQLGLQWVAGDGPCSVYKVAGLANMKSLLHGAQLLPCRAVPLDDFEPERDSKLSPNEQEGCLAQDQARYELMLRVQWQAAPVGHEVGSRKAATVKLRVW